MSGLARRAGFVVALVGLVSACSDPTLHVVVYGEGDVTSQPAGIDCGTRCELELPHALSVTLTATPHDGFVLAGWEGETCAGIEPCFVKLDGDATVVARFAAIQHDLTVSRSGDGVGTVNSIPNGISCGAACTTAFDQGTSVTLVATPAPDSMFIGWSGAGCTGMETCVVTLDTAITVDAAFALNPTLEVTMTGTGSGLVLSNPPGIDCGVDCVQRYPVGSEIVLSATPSGSNNSRFDGWSGACTGTGTCSVTLDQATTVTASFTALVDLAVDFAGTGYGVVTSIPSGINCPIASCLEYYAPGTVVTLTATPVPFSTFTGWSNGCSGVGTCIVTVTTSLRPTATFMQVANDLTSFAFLTANNPTLAMDVTATITGTTIRASVPGGTNLAALKATFTTTGTGVTVAGVPQLTGMTANDFTSPLVYRVTATDASTKDYTVTVAIGHPLAFAKTDVSTASQPIFVATADINGDGKPDLGVTTAGNPPGQPGRLSVALNTTAMNATTPSFSASVAYLVGANPWSFAFGDINGDGRPDLVSTSMGSSFAVLFNTTPPNGTTPSFALAIGIGTGGATAVAIDDFNRDGKPDVAVAGGSTLSIFLNTTATNETTPSFASGVDFTTGNCAFSVASGDLNGDGGPDLAVVNECDESVSIFLDTTAANATVASFSPRVDLAVGIAPYSVAFGDFNGDGKPDVAVTNAHQSVNTVSVFLDTTATAATTPTFAPRADFATGSSPVCVAVGDLDGDTRPDLAIASSNAGGVSVLLDLTAPNAMSPVFAPRTDFGTGQYPRSVAIADFNRDGLLDLVVTNQGSSTLSVLLAF